MQIGELISKKRFTVLLGKNGAGKSSLLRALDERNDLNTKYITPERGGTLKYQANIDQNMVTNANWLKSTRRRNRAEEFRYQSAAQFRAYEMLFLREIEKDPIKRADPTVTFDAQLSALNQYLPAIRLVRADRGFSIADLDGNSIDEDSISSGESEFIAQAIELLVYAQSSETEKHLLIDEPDVHLHPDLQAKFVALIEQTAVARDLKVIIATHSTAIISGFSEQADLQVVPVSRRDQAEFEGFERHRVSDELLPIFGAHPLSSVFNRSPIVLVEGEDDRRVIEQAVRTAQGNLRLTPVPVNTVQEMSKWENWLNKFLPVIYDSPSAYSLRDLDDSVVCDIGDLPYVKRVRLNCYAIENLLLTNESLAAGSSSPAMIVEGLKSWATAYPAHSAIVDVNLLVSNFSERRVINIKSLRNILVAVMGVTKPWEVHLGQLLGMGNSYESKEEHSLSHYLGSKAVALFRRET